MFGKKVGNHQTSDDEPNIESKLGGTGTERNTGEARRHEGGKWNEQTFIGLVVVGRGKTGEVRGLVGKKGNGQEWSVFKRVPPPREEKKRLTARAVGVWLAGYVLQAGGREGKGRQGVESRARERERRQNWLHWRMIQPFFVPTASRPGGFTWQSSAAERLCARTHKEEATSTLGAVRRVPPLEDHSHRLCLKMTSVLQRPYLALLLFTRWTFKPTIATA